MIRAAIRTGERQWQCRSGRSWVRGFATGTVCLALTGCLAARHGASRLQPDRQQEFTVEFSAVDIPAEAGHHGGPQPAPLWATAPATGWLHGFAIELIDARGDTVPSALLHHLKLMSPRQRELFKPIMLRLVGAGAETRAAYVPGWLGLPIQEGDSLLATAMLHNPTGQSYDGVRLRLRLRYTPDGLRDSPTAVYPFFMHVTPPDQHSGYDLPPGRTTRSWEARPAVAGRILGFGGHLHRYATELRFEDATTGRVLWRTRPKLAADGEVLEVPRKLYVWGRGIAVHPERTYRVTAVYDNPTGETVIDGGMATVAGIIRPAGAWPLVDRADPLYQFDRGRELYGNGAHHGNHHH